MILIGLTGNIACGKSTVGKMLEELGARRIDADLVVHQEMAPGRPMWQGIVAAFGRGILKGDETIDRAKLAGIVFADPAELKRLEEITHPAALRAIEAEIAVVDGEVVVIEAVKLIEAGWHTRVNSLWVVTCSEQAQLERMVRDRAMSEGEARARLGAQPSRGEYRRLFDVIIDNSGTRDETFEQVKRALVSVQCRD